MLISQLIGGNEVQGFRDGKVFVNDILLPATYYELGNVCGNIPTDAIDTEMSYNRRVRDYVAEVSGTMDMTNLEALNFVNDNRLMLFVSYSTYKINTEDMTLELHISAFEN